MNEYIEKENQMMMDLANHIVCNASPEEDARSEVAYAIARYLGLDWPAAAQTIVVDAETARKAAMDAERLDWLTRHISGKELRRVLGDDNAWPAWSPAYSRASIDAAIAAQGECDEHG